MQIDVFSFGIVMWELLTGEEPYENMHCGAIIGTAALFLMNAYSSYCKEEERLFTESKVNIVQAVLLIILYVHPYQAGVILVGGV